MAMPSRDQLQAIIDSAGNLAASLAGLGRQTEADDIRTLAAAALKSLNDLMPLPPEAALEAAPAAIPSGPIHRATG